MNARLQNISNAFVKRILKQYSEQQNTFDYYRVLFPFPKVRLLGSVVGCSLPALIFFALWFSAGDVRSTASASVCARVRGKTKRRASRLRIPPDLGSSVLGYRALGAPGRSRSWSEVRPSSRGEQSLSRCNGISSACCCERYSYYI